VTIRVHHIDFIVAVPVRSVRLFSAAKPVKTAIQFTERDAVRVSNEDFQIAKLTDTDDAFLIPFRQWDSNASALPPTMINCESGGNGEILRV